MSSHQANGQSAASEMELFRESREFRQLMNAWIHTVAACDVSQTRQRERRLVVQSIVTRL